MKVAGYNIPDLVLIGGGALVALWAVQLAMTGEGPYGLAATEDPQPQTLPVQGPPPRPDRPPRGGGGGPPGMQPGPPRPRPGPGNGDGHPGGPPAGHPGPWPRPGPPNRPPDWRIPRPDPRRPHYPAPPRFHWPTFGFRIPRYPWLGLPENNISYEQCVWAGEQLGKDITNCCQDAFSMGRNILINEVENCLYCNQRDC